jgi:Zn-dependent protease
LLFALGEPVAFVALVAAFVLALVLRAVAIRLCARTLGMVDRRESIGPRLREDIDPFGAVAAAIGGQGWGKVISVDEIHRGHGRGRAAAVFLSGPLVCILAAQFFFLGYALTTPLNVLGYLQPSDVLHGMPLPVGEQALLSFAVGLLTFGLLALIPIPPLDGFGALWSAMRRPGPGMQWMRLWFEEKNLGVLILLICCFFPLTSPILLMILDVLGVLFVRLWG